MRRRCRLLIVFFLLMLLLLRSTCCSLPPRQEAPINRRGCFVAVVPAVARDGVVTKCVHPVVRVFLALSALSSI